MLLLGEQYVYGMMIKPTIVGDTTPGEYDEKRKQELQKSGMMPKPFDKKAMGVVTARQMTHYPYRRHSLTGL